MKTVSFDVFETVIQRSVWPPSAVYQCVGKQLDQLGLLSCNPVKFSFEREKSEIKAFRMYGPSYNLERIYSLFDKSLLVRDLDWNFISNIEENVELELANPNPAVINLIHRWRDSNYYICFLSDTYLSSSAILNILKKVNAYESGDFLYVSNEYGAFKKNGKLFKEILKKSNSHKIERHYGNSMDADFRGANAAGIKGVCLKRGNATYLESLQEGFGRSNDLAARLLGAQRLVRIKAEDEAKLTSLKIELATGLLAPLNIALMMWALARARSNSNKKLYLLSRDGWLMWKMALSTAPEWFEGIEIKYLYTSRQALSGMLSEEHIEYLKKAGVFSSDPICLVDVGWRGSLHEALCKIRLTHGLIPLNGYFLGLDSCDDFSFANYRDSIIKSSDFPDNIPGRIDSSVKFIVESMFCAPHGSVVGFSFADETPKPMFDKFYTDHQNNYGYGAMCSLAVEVFRLFVSDDSMSNMTSDADFWAKYIKNLIDHFSFAAPQDLAAEIGDLPVELDQGDIRWLPLAPEIAWLDALKVIFSGRSPKKHDRQWSHGSWLRAPRIRRQMGRLLFSILRKRNHMHHK